MKTQDGWLVYRELRGKTVVSEFFNPVDAQIYLDKIHGKGSIEKVQRDILEGIYDIAGPWRKVD
jgi:hypothetical protein